MQGYGSLISLQHFSTQIDAAGTTSEQGNNLQEAVPDNHYESEVIVTQLPRTGANTAQEAIAAYECEQETNESEQETNNPERVKAYLTAHP